MAHGSLPKPRSVLTFLGVVGVCAAISGTFYLLYAHNVGTIGLNHQETSEVHLS